MQSSRIYVFTSILAVQIGTLTLTTPNSLYQSRPTPYMVRLSNIVIVPSIVIINVTKYSNSTSDITKFGNLTKLMQVQMHAFSNAISLFYYRAALSIV